MPYVLRSADGKIVKVTTQPLHGAEVLPYEDPQIQAFLDQAGQDAKDIGIALRELRQTDADMTRAVEDVITALLKKNILKLTDLPKPVQERMALRVKLRVKIQDHLDRATQEHERQTFAAKARRQEDEDGPF